MTQVDNIFAHGNAPTALMGRPSYYRHRADTIQNRHRGEFRCLVGVLRTRGVACVLFTGVPPQEQTGSTDRNCASNDNSISKLYRCRLQNLSVASTASASASAISRSWLSRSRQKRTWRSSLASIRERLADGLRTTLSRLRRRSGSSSARSCVDTTSAIKPRRRPF